MSGFFELFNPSYQPKISLVIMKPANDKMITVMRNGTFYSTSVKTKPT